MSLTIHVNTGASDVAIGGGEWTEVDTSLDQIIFSDGSDTVADGEAIPSSSQLNSASPLVNGIEQTFEKYFLADASSATLKEIINMGAGNKRYVIAFVFSASTVSEPTLELWDDTDMDSIDSVPLGAGTPSASWFRGITTTDGLPGGGWTGTRLAGSFDGFFLWLNNQAGQLSGAENLYCQLKLVIPATELDGGVATPVIAVKYASI